MSCCALFRETVFGHDKSCHNNPNKGKAFMDYPDGIGDVRFHYFDGRTNVLKAVEFDSIGGDANGHKGDVTGQFETGDLFHVPNVAWWEVIYD